MTAADTRRFLAEEIRVTANIRSPRLIDAIATIPRDRFLPPGPWLIRGVADMGGGPRQTDDADPRHVHHDVAVAIDPARDLYNGQPSLIAGWLEAAGVAEGQRVIHIGCGTGYFTAWIAHVVGPAGSVHAMDVDPDLASRARANLADRPWVTVVQGNGTTALPPGADVVIVHAGATHVLDVWLDTLNDGGRLLLPLTMAAPGMPANIGKGPMLLVTRHGAEWRARCFSIVAIYSLKDARDETLGAELAKMLMSGAWMRVTRLRRDAHERGDTCVLHGRTTCLSGDAAKEMGQ
jgi:protein-L-isoaspartate(D-aspartate) O-methyltransferase